MLQPPCDFPNNYDAIDCAIQHGDVYDPDIETAYPGFSKHFKICPACKQNHELSGWLASIDLTADAVPATASGY